MNVINLLSEWCQEKSSGSETVGRMEIVELLCTCLKKREAPSLPGAKWCSQGGMVVAILMREKTAPPGTNEIYIPGWHSRHSWGSSGTRGSCWTWLLALRAATWGRPGDVCTDKKTPASISESWEGHGEKIDFNSPVAALNNRSEA